MVSLLPTLNGLPLLMLANREIGDRLDLHLTPPLTSYMMTGELFGPQTSASSSSGDHFYQPHWVQIRIQWSYVYKEPISFLDAVNSKNDPQFLPHFIIYMPIYNVTLWHHPSKRESYFSHLLPWSWAHWPGLVNKNLVNVESAWNLCIEAIATGHPAVTVL